MKLLYEPDTVSRYIDLNATVDVDEREIVDGVMLDIDAEGRPVGIDIQHASAVLDLSTIETRALPVSIVNMG